MRNDQKTPAGIVFLLFFVSGFCSLLYQIVWLRLAFASFGIITPVLSVLLSVFMLGLALGSWAAGRYTRTLSEKTGQTAIAFYAAAELLIGIGGLLVPQLFSWGESLLLSKGSFDSANYLFLSAGVLCVTVLPWCVLMGATIPLMMDFLKGINREERGSFGFLYFANVAGAVLGAAVTAWVLIEAFGFRGTLAVAVAGNFMIAAVSFILSRKYPLLKQDRGREKTVKVSGLQAEGALQQTSFFLLLGMTGFVSMASEVAWTRAFTPILGNTIYAFASILAVYLLSTAFGTLVYRFHAARKKEISLETLVGHLSYACFLPVILGDPRVAGLFLGRPRLTTLVCLSGIIPFCALLGYLTPKLIDGLSRGDAKTAGKAYAVNTLGCILGPLAAGYALLPVFGIRGTLIILTIPLILFFAFLVMKNSGKRPSFALFAGTIAAVLFFVSWKISLTHEEGEYAPPKVIRRDHVATVIAHGSGLDKQLLVNGIGMTHMTTVTKSMAHIPLTIRGANPESILMICFGMGTTFRSAAAWNIQTTAVELVPSVKEVFGFFFPDAERIMDNKKNQIVVDDGRRFLKRTKEQYDVISIDPPPPIEASGTSLLYSEDFYKIVKDRLKEDGILQQWMAISEGDVVPAAARAVANQFPYVRAFHSIDGWGIHFFASKTPFEMPTVEEFVARLPQAAAADFVEWTPGRTPGQLYQGLLQRPVPLESILSPDKKISITDDRPYNEYFWLREGLRAFRKN